MKGVKWLAIFKVYASNIGFLVKMIAVIKTGY